MIKKVFYKCLFLVVVFGSTNVFAGNDTFDFTGASSATQTVSGVTVTATSDTGTLGAWDDGLYDSSNTGSWMEFSFSKPIDILSFYIGISASTGDMGTYTITAYNGNSQVGTYGSTPDWNAMYDGNAKAPYKVTFENLNYGLIDKIKVQHNDTGTVSYIADTIVFVSNTNPTFNAGATNTLTVYKNSGATDIKPKLLVTDTDIADTLTWTQSSAPTHGTLNFTSATSSAGTSVESDGTITYTPSTDYLGSDSFVIQVSDGTATDTITINVTVSSVLTTFSTLTEITTNDKAEPVTPFTGLTLTDDDSEVFTAIVSIDTSDKGTLSTTTITSGTLTEVQTAIQAITFTPAENRVAVNSTETTTITLRVTADGVTAEKTNTVVSTSMNDAPTDIALNGLTLNQDDSENTIIGGLTTTDVDDSDGVTYSLVSEFGDNSNFNIDNTNLRATNANMSVGTYSVKVKVTDTNGLTFEKEFTITVVDNVNPVITTSSTINMINATTSVVVVSGTDSESLSWSVTGGADENAFSIDSSTGLLTLNNAAVIGTQSSYTVEVSTFDGTNTVTKSITITVLEPVILNYQGFLSTTDGAVNTTLSIEFKLYDALTGGNEVWSSTKDIVISKGIYNVPLGEAVMLNDLNFLTTTYYLGISIASNEEMTPRQLITPSGYTKLLLDKINSLHLN